MQCSRVISNSGTCIYTPSGLHDSFTRLTVMNCDVRTYLCALSRAKTIQLRVIYYWVAIYIYCSARHDKIRRSLTLILACTSDLLSRNRKIVFLAFAFDSLPITVNGCWFSYWSFIIDSDGSCDGAKQQKSSAAASIACGLQADDNFRQTNGCTAAMSII